MVIRKRVKYLIVRNPLYVIGLKDIIFLKILQEKTRTPISYLQIIYLKINCGFYIMRLKSELYKKEQEAIVEKIIKILDLTKKQTYTLYELDKNENIQNNIMQLIPEIRKYFSFNGLKAVGEPKRIKRPWLSIIKQLTKTKYKVESKDLQLTENGKIIRTHIYKFELI